jgi:hypothetical protein
MLRLAADRGNHRVRIIRMGVAPLDTYGGTGEPVPGPDSYEIGVTGVCVARLCAFTEHFDRVATAGTKVYGIVVDSLPALAASKRAHAIGVDLLSDLLDEPGHRRENGGLPERVRQPG